MADSDVIGNFTDAALVFNDGSSLSATCTLMDGNFSIELPNNGREVGEYQAQGELVGLRYEARAFATLSVTGHLTTPLDAFSSLATGITSGAVSTTADIGDVFCGDVQLTATYGTSTRRYAFEDMRMESMSHNGGSPNNRTLNFKGYAKVTLTDQTGTTKTLVAGR